MSYCKDSYCRGSHCVCQIVREIVSAQDEAANNVDDGCCLSSCEQSIHDLLAPSTGNNASGHTTIPFILYCKSSCRPFFGSGVYQTSENAENLFGGVRTPIFRAKNFINDEDCCVRLELLAPVAGTTIIDDADDVNDLFQQNSITHFHATGICITVDLNNFIGIQCLPATTPRPSSTFPAANN